MPIAVPLRRSGSPVVVCTPAGVDALIKRSWALRYADPDGSLRAALRARAIACGGHVGSELQARAAAEAGNAVRRYGRWREAEALFAEAERLGSGDRALLARLASYRGSLCHARRLWREAHAALDRAEAGYLALRDREGVARVRVQRGIAWTEAGEPERARPVLADVFADAPSAEILRLSAQPYVWAVLETGDARSAATYMRLFGSIMSAEEPLYRARVEWLRGKVALALGELDEARRLLLPVREWFAGARLVQDAALVGVDLARVELQVGDLAAVAKMVAEAVPLLRVLGLEVDALAAELLRGAGAGVVLAEVGAAVRALPSYYRRG